MLSASRNHDPNVQEPDAATGPTKAGRARPHTLEAALHGPNGLTAIRLGLAWLVLLSHSWPLSGTAGVPRVGTVPIGDIAVAGFFAISGYLVTGSRLRLGVIRFLWHRFLRIFPAYWVMLIVVAFGLAPMVSLLAGEHWTARAAAHHLRMNWATHVQDFTIAGTLTHVPYGPTWNGSTWTLWYELLCYLLVAVAFVPVASRRDHRWTAAVALALLVLNSSVHLSSDLAFVKTLFQLLPLAGTFAAGATLRLYAHRVPLRAGLALCAGALLAVSCWFGQVYSLGGFPMAYLVMWGGVRVPVRMHTDLSYGVYIYAFPIQQTLVNFGLLHNRPLALAAATTGLVMPVAAASWHLLERPALRLKAYRPEARLPIRERPR